MQLPPYCYENYIPNFKIENSESKLILIDQQQFMKCGECEVNIFHFPVIVNISGKRVTMPVWKIMLNKILVQVFSNLGKYRMIYT